MLKREQCAFWTPITLHWADMDSFHHVNNARYFTFMETGRISLFKHLLDLSYAGVPEVGPILAHIGCNYRKPIEWPATLHVGTGVEKVGNTSFTLQQGVFIEGEDTAAADGPSVVVWYDYQAGEKRPLPDNLRAALEPLVVKRDV